MRRIKNNDLLRVRLSISQQDLADYIGVSRSQLTMHERGFRSLPTAALLKLGDLELNYHNFLNEDKSKKPLAAGMHPQMQKHRENTIKSMKNRIKSCHLKKKMLQYELDKMTSKHANSETWSQLLDKMLKEFSGQETISNDQKWLELQKEAALKKMIRFGAVSQAKHQAKINLLDAEADIYSKLHEKL